MRIGELAARSGVSTRALRYYEEQNLLSARRSPSGQRHYGDEAVDRVRLIRSLYAAGLSSTVIARLLPCVHTGVASPAQLALMLSERSRIQRRIDELDGARDRLDQVIEVATGRRGVPADCGDGTDRREPRT